MKFDAAAVRRLLSPNAYRDLDSFIESMPLRAGYASVVAGIVCLVVACLAVTYMSVQAGDLMRLRADILKAEALKPTVPVITKVPVDDQEVADFIKKMSDFYPQLTVTSRAGGHIEIRSKTTDKYGAFREAVGHAFNGGKGWRLSVDALCVGRECKNNNDALYGSFTVYRFRVAKPEG